MQDNRKRVSIIGSIWFLTGSFIVFFFLNEMLESKNKIYLYGKLGGFQTLMPDKMETVHSHVFTEFLDMAGTSDEAECYVEEIKEYPNIQKKLKALDIYSIYDFSLCLRAINEFNTEKSLLESHFRLNEINYNEFDQYITYLEKHLLDPAIIALKTRQIYKSKWLCSQLVERLFLIDTQPLDNVAYNTSLKINKILLFCALTDNPVDCFRMSSSIDSLIPFYSHTQKRLIINADLNRGTPNLSPLSEYKEYWAGLRCFHEKKYLEAYTLFSKLAESNIKNNLLRELTLVMVSRCLLWDFIENKKMKSTTLVKELISVRNNIKTPNFSSDVQYYIDFINDTLKTKKSENNISSRQDLIDALIEILESKRNN